MKEYIKPEIVISEISNTDVVTISGGLVTTKFNKSADGKGYNEVSF